MTTTPDKIQIIEDTKYDRGPLTIEKMLHLYESHPDKSVRSAVMWHAWNQNKAWLTRMLELTLASFPSYSRHDASHAEAVLHNIERVLGESRIRELSATDCFAILHTVYIHDIGMSILAADRKKIVKSDEFIEMIEELAAGVESDLRDDALRLKKWCYSGKWDSENEDLEGKEYHEKKGTLYEEKLQTYDAVVRLIANFQRRYHGDKVASDVREWLSRQDMLGSEFAMSGIPMRIFLRIADCARLHTDWEFNHIMDLPQEENGYENDMMHPRFVAILLQIGDALDIDNDRFHPFAEAFVGGLPDDSQAHYEKHLSVRTLKITPDEILIEADCNSREAIHLIKSECDGLETLLKSASYKWTSIAPRGFSGALPSFQLKSLKLKGIEIPSDLAMTRFKISQTKAFSLLQGRNIYSDEFPFVRELLQNAIDSTKLQCYNDYKTSSKFRYHNEEKKIPSITNISDIINPVEYPIKISLDCCLLEKGKEAEIIALDKFPGIEEEGKRYGLLFSIEDYGTGINSDSIRAISNVGSSYKNRRKLLREMPDWLRPTGEFGIGLQSVFLVSDKFSCETYVRNGERYRIEFLTGSKGEKGYINVNPVDPEKNAMHFGTRFEVFIPHEKRKEHRKTDSGEQESRIGNRETADSMCRYDPFSDSYENSEIRRNIEALATQILMDIDRQLGDLLFPVYASVGFDLENKKMLMEQLHSIVLDMNGKNDNFTEEKLKEHICWMYRKDNSDSNNVWIPIDEDYFLVDLEKMEVYMWLAKMSIVACISVEHLLSDNAFAEPSWCDVFYKGILLERYQIPSGESMVEYIDILGGQKGRDLIQLSRDGLSQDGKMYIQDEVLPAIDHKLLRVLKDLASRTYNNSDDAEKKCAFSEKIRDIFEKYMKPISKTTDANTDDDPDARNLERLILGISMYYNFYAREIESEHREYTTRALNEEKRQWQLVLQTSSQYAVKYYQIASPENTRITGPFKIVRVYMDCREKDFWILGSYTMSIADVMDRRNKFLVVSRRRSRDDKWANSIVLISPGKKQTQDQEYTKQSIQLMKDLENDYKYNRDAESFRNIMESWGNFMLSSFRNDNEALYETLSMDDSERVQWLMGNVPVRACFMDNESNFKIHVLLGRNDKGIFYNRNGKHMVLQAMIERHKRFGGERFAGNVWSGFEYLAVRECSNDICRVREAYMRQNIYYMIFPCTGEAASDIGKFMNPSESDSNIVVKNGDGSVTNVPIREWKNELSEAGNSIYDCFVTPENAQDSEPSQIREAYDKCRRRGEVISRNAFIEGINRGYQFYLKWKWKKHKEQSKELPMKVSGVDEARKLLDAIKEQRIDCMITYDVIRSDIYANEQYLRNAAWEDVERHSTYLDDGLGEFFEYAESWNRMWNYLAELETTGNFEEIKKQYWNDTNEKNNLIQWMVKNEGKDKAAVEECYEMVWDEMEDMAKNRRRQAVMMGMYHHKLSDWIKKQEDDKA